jgi:hypothetical protein
LRMSFTTRILPPLNKFVVNCIASRLKRFNS